MAFKMNVSSCQVTSVSNELNGRAGDYVQALSTEPAIMSANLKPAFENALTFNTASVNVANVQQVGSKINPTETGRA